MEPEAARREAALAFGGVERVKEEVREARGLGVGGRIGSDVAYAFRSFRSGRSGLLMSALVLAMAIGAGTTIFSVVSGVLLNSLPYREPDRLVSVHVIPLERRTGESGGGTMSGQSLDLVLSGTGAFESAAYFYGAGQPVLLGMGEPERVDAWRVAPEFFQVLGSRALVGRALNAADTAVAEGNPVVLSHRFWMSHFGGAPDIVGRTFRLGDEIEEVVGVMPPDFDFPSGAQLWESAPPLAPLVGPPGLQGRYWLVGRLAPGLSSRQARDRVDARFAAFGGEHPVFAKWGPNFTPLREVFTGPVRKPLLLLLAAVVLVLLVGCANVAAVLLARGVARRKELAIRVSMGATRGRVARQLVLEAVLLALLSGVAGTLIALAGVPLLVALMGEQLPEAARIAVDGRVLAATLAASTITGILAGVLPALLIVREDVSAALRDGGSGTGTSSWRTRVGEGLVVLQVGLGTVLVTSALVLALSFINLMRVDFGFEPARVAVARFSLPSERYTSTEQRRAFVAEVQARAAAIPGVESVAVSDGIPFDGGAVGSVEIPGEEVPEDAPWAWFTYVTPDYFRTLGIALIRGHPLPPSGSGVGSAVLVNEAFVRTYFGGKDPIGRTVEYFDGSTRGEIVGVVADTRQESLAEPAPPQIYAALKGGGYLKVSARTRDDPDAVAGALRRAVRDVDPLLPIDDVGGLSKLVDESVTSQRFLGAVVSSFALLALLITALGIYALTAYTVSRRSREIGIRMALGATEWQIRRTTIGRATRLAGAGVALGLVGAMAAAKLLNSYVFGLSPSDPRILLGAMLLLVVATVAAAYAPARRATRIDPMIVLRTD
jgi:predicted permease